MGQASSLGRQERVRRIMNFTSSAIQRITDSLTRLIEKGDGNSRDGGSETRLREIEVLSDVVVEGAWFKLFKAVHRDSEGNQTAVAIKIANPGAEGLIREEQRVLNALQNDPHQNVVRRFTTDLQGIRWQGSNIQRLRAAADKGRLIVLEGVSCTLHDVICGKNDYLRNCTYSRMVYLFLDIAYGLSHLHAIGFLHSDMNPENILIADDGKAMVAGFGHCVTLPERTVYWRLAGTFGYIAPELLYPFHRGQSLRITFSTDVYSLGVIMMQCLMRLNPNEILTKRNQDVWAAIRRCCEGYSDNGDSIFTTDPNLFNSLQRLNGVGMFELQAWPDEFLRLAKRPDGSASGSTSASAGHRWQRSFAESASHTILTRLQNMTPNYWDRRKYQFPPELCELIVECYGYVNKGEYEGFEVSRIRLGAVVDRLERMLSEPWINYWPFWVTGDSILQAVSEDLPPNGCKTIDCLGLGEGRYGSVRMGVYKDPQGIPHFVAVKFMDNSEKGRAAAEYELQLYDHVQRGGGGRRRNVVYCIGGDPDLDLEHVQPIHIADNTNFLVLDYHPRNLKELLREYRNHGKRCTYEDFLILFIDIADGLAFLHERGVIHFDLNPRNVLIGEDGKPRIVDFNKAKIAEGSSITATFRGTRGYMAPEIVLLAMERHTNAVDIFSMGVMMWDFLSCEEQQTHFESPNNSPVEPEAGSPPLSKRSTSASSFFKSIADFLRCKRSISTVDVDRSTRNPEDDPAEREPAELWAFIRDCVSTSIDPTTNRVKRPTAAELAAALRAMQGRPWNRQPLPWVRQNVNEN